MSLRLLFLLYWLLVHLSAGAVLGWLLWEKKIWFVAIELTVLVSFLVAIWLLKRMMRPVEAVAEGLNIIQDANLNSFLPLAGQPESDRIIHTYNRMIHHLRNARMQAQEKHFFLDKIIQASLSGILILDYEDNIILTNRSLEKMFGFTAAELIGQPLRALGYPFAEVFERLEDGKSEVFALHAQANRRIKCTRSSFFDQGFPRTFFMLEELTEELRLSEKAAYEKLIRVLSHEINNSIGAANSLLNSCLLYANQLEGEDREDFETALQVVISRTEHLNAFMRSYANVIRLGEPKRQEWDVRQVLEGIALLYSRELSQRRIALRWRIDEKIQPFASFDRAQMEQVWVNMIKNAMEAIGHDGIITLRISLNTEGKLVVSVADTGPGIPAHIRQNLFTPFFSTKDNGQGIGLTMIQEILNRHQFGFSLDSEEGKGTDFQVVMH